MADEICQVVQRIAILFQEIEHVLRHIGTSLDKYVTPLRHQDTAVTRTQVNRLHRFRQMAETLRVNLYDLASPSPIRSLEIKKAAAASPHKWPAFGSALIIIASSYQRKAPKPWKPSPWRNIPPQPPSVQERRTSRG